MIDIKVSQFFDKPAVLKKVKDGTKSALSKIGAMIWQRARTSIRKRKKVAQPGNPPSSHLGFLRDLMRFGYDDYTDSVVVGPHLFGKRRKPSVPELLEFGGETVNDKGKRAVYRKFPTMALALAAEQQNIPNAFKGCVR